MSVTPDICINYRKAHKPFSNPKAKNIKNICNHKAKIISLKV